MDYEFKSYLQQLDVSHAKDLGWERLTNGELIAVAENAGFNAMLTVDKGVRHQQSLKGRRISVVTLDTARVTLPYLTPLIGSLLMALTSLQPGSFISIRPE